MGCFAHQQGGKQMPMTQMKLELAEKLDRLDPGSFLPISPTLLEEVFGSGRPIEVLMQAVEQFAEAHQCTFSYHGHFEVRPEFTKDDVF
jgi:hypothetical protein